MTMALFPLLMHRHPCRCQAGIIALVTMASLPLIHNGVIALVVMASLPSSSWRFCPHCNRVVIIVDMQASLPSSQWCVAYVAMALLPSMCRHFCHCFDCDCHPHDNGVVAIVDAQESLLLSSWHHCPRNNGIVALDPKWHCCPCCNDVIAILKLASLTSSQWHCHHHQCTVVLAVIVMVLLPLSC